MKEKEIADLNEKIANKLDELDDAYDIVELISIRLDQDPTQIKDYKIRYSYPHKFMPLWNCMYLDEKSNLMYTATGEDKNAAMNAIAEKIVHEKATFKVKRKGNA